MNSAVDEMLELKQRVGRLLETIAEQRTEMVAGRRKSRICRCGSKRCRRGDTHQQELAVIRPMIGEISPHVAALLERLDRQAEAIRSLYGAGTKREAALDELSSGLAKLRASRATASAMTPDEL